MPNAMLWHTLVLPRLHFSFREDTASPYMLSPVVQSAVSFGSDIVMVKVQYLQSGHRL
jgi:hypothetical protein